MPGGVRDLVMLPLLFATAGTYMRDFLELFGTEKGSTAVILRVRIALLVAPCVGVVLAVRQTIAKTAAEAAEAAVEAKEHS